MTAKRILVIDDGPDIRLVAKAGLKKIGGWDVLTAASGSEGLVEAEVQHPDAILLDVMMPGMDGPTLVRELRARPSTRDIPVIFLTALTETDEDQMAALGVRGVISKPFDPLRLHERVTEILEEGVEPSAADLPSLADGETASPSEDFPHDEITQIWERFKETNLERLAVLEAAAMAQLEGQLDGELRRHAEREAHKLAGAAGSFGFAEGSRLAKELEKMLAGAASLSQAQTLRCTELVVALREELGRPMEIARDRREPRPDADDAAKAGTGASVVRGVAPYLLIVGCDSTTAERLVLEAAARGMRVEAVDTAAAAQEEVAREQPDVVLLDLSNPQRTEENLALLGRLTNRIPGWSASMSGGISSIPVLILTDRDTFIDRVQVAALGGRAFLQKPLLSSEVLNAIVDVLHQVRATNGRVLAVDDDPELLAALGTILEPHGIDLLTLTNPMEFWDVLERTSPDLLILDVDMPGVNGLDLCRVVRSDLRWGTLPVIFLSGRTDPETVQAVFDVRADDFVGKPVVGPELLTRVANRLERSQLFRRMAEMDMVTGLVNRHKSTQMLDGFLRMADRNGQPVALAVIHVDHFKEINDRHGHVAGDAVLHRIGELLVRTFRREDVISRWGGAEFVVGLYGMAKADGVQRLTEILDTLRHEPFAGPAGDKFPVTFSAGVAGYMPSDDGSQSDGVTVQALYRSADEALSQVKKIGGNRVAPAGWQLDEGRAVRSVDVVVVDDDESLAALLIHAMETRGYRTEWLTDGEVAIESLGGPSPSLQARVVLLDVDLPGLDGMRVLRHLTEWGVTRRTRVMMLTYRSTEAEVLKALELGAFDHVAKPFSLPVLVQRICRAMDD